MEMYAAPAFRVLQAAAVAFVAILANAVAMSVAQAVALHRRLRWKQAAPAAYVLHTAAYQVIFTIDVSGAWSESPLPNYSPKWQVKSILLVVNFFKRICTHRSVMGHVSRLAHHCIRSPFGPRGAWHFIFHGHGDSQTVNRGLTPD